MKILKIYIDSLVIHEDGARSIYKIRVFNMIFYTSIYKLMLSTRF